MLSMKEIYEISAGVEYHLKQLSDFTEVLREVKQSLDEIRYAQEGRYSWELQLLRNEFSDIKRQLKRYGLPESTEYETSMARLKESIEDERWPKAVPDESICNTPEAANKRAEAILDLVISENLKDKKFLDYGCGEGHEVAKAIERGSQAIGYDVDLSKSKYQEPWITADFKIVEQNGPYDVVLIHDVLDHIALMSPVEALDQVRRVLKPTGVIYVRNHPWSSRHGGHLYTSINKAYAHLVFDEVELMRLGGYECDPNIKIITPLGTYRYWFQQAGLEIKSEIPIKEEVEPYFLQNPKVFDRLKDLWEDETEIVPNMEIGFVEYILEMNQVNRQQML